MHDKQRLKQDLKVPTSNLDENSAKVKTKITHTWMRWEYQCNSLLLLQAKREMKMNVMK